ncbi:MAG TPA: glycosyltransferase 87 family protein, partial [Candidatus Omnitrophota bacterium]|nr:glycosyltransferase 87 family protein [Candidatus Omnitrophota bacterium]
MINKKDAAFFWISFAVLICVSFLAKFASGWIVRALYASNSMDLLSMLTGARQLFPVEFYIGQLDDRFFGPLSILSSAVAFLWLGLRFLPQWTSTRMFVYFLVYFVVSRWETFLFPPYGDSASGPMMEAVWLLQNNFDFIKLSQQPLFIVGGPKAYLFSLYPAFQALLMKFTPTPQAYLIVSHGITYLFSAAVMTLFFKILLRIWDAPKSFLLTFLLLSLPLTQSQVEQINMEVPTLIFIVAAFYYLAKKDVLKAAIFSGLAIFVKIYALFAAATIFVSGLFLFFFDEEKRGKRSILFSSFLAILFALLGAWLLCFVINPAGKVDKVGPLQGWPLMRQFPITYFFIISSIVYV